MKNTWNKYFFIITAGILAFIIIVITVIVSGHMNNPPHNVLIPTPPPSVPSTSEISVAPSIPVPTAMMNKEGNKPVLSQNDIFAEQQILSILPADDPSGVVYESNNVKIDYDSNSDKFLTEILTKDIAGAKAETVAWFGNQGMSQQGICILPVIFYLSPEVSQLYKIQGQTITFNPQPDGCAQ